MGLFFNKLCLIFVPEEIYRRGTVMPRLDFRKATEVGWLRELLTNEEGTETEEQKAGLSEENMAEELTRVIAVEKA